MLDEHLGATHPCEECSGELALQSTNRYSDDGAIITSRWVVCCTNESCGRSWLVVRQSRSPYEWADALIAKIERQHWAQKEHEFMIEALVTARDAPSDDGLGNPNSIDTLSARHFADLLIDDLAHMRGG